VTQRYAPAQPSLEGIVDTPDIAAIVARTTELTAQQTIDIPRILIVPQGEMKSGFKEFQLDISNVHYQPISNELWQQELRTGKSRLLTLGEGSIDELRLEDYVVSGLVDYDDVSYDDHADLLYDLASQTVHHFLRYLNEEDTRRILRVYQKEISRLIHAQMQEHYWEDAVGYEVKISKGFTELKPQRAYTHVAGEAMLDFRQSPADKSNMSRYLFSGFSRCLYSEEKFQSDSERMLSVILERESLKWFKPAKGQFQIFYKWGSEHAEYQPDFVAETEDTIYMLEPKARNQMGDPEVLAKRDSAVAWCKHASDYAGNYDGKPWKYLLIPHDAIAENMTLEGLAERFHC
jgi:type III restriction enzyme